MGVLSRLLGSLGDRLAQRHTKQCKLLKNTLKQFARFFLLKFPNGDSFLKKWWESLLKTPTLLTILLNEVGVFGFSHKNKSLNS